ncbi:MAG: molybdopterin-dependent oxidoreductase [Acidimicrobiales bacterium]
MTIESDGKRDTFPADESTTTPWYLAALAGALAAGLALGVAELLSGISKRVPSLVDSIADWTIDNGFEALDNWSRSTFGTSQKTVLVTGITITAIVFGAIAGVMSRNDHKVGIYIFGAFAVVGGLATWSYDLANTKWGWFAAAVTGLVGAGSLPILLYASAHRSPAPVGRLGGASLFERRRFLTMGGGAAVAGWAASAVGKSLTNGRNVAAGQATVAEALDTIPTTAPVATEVPVVAPAAATVPNLDYVDGLSSLVTPADEFYLIDTAVTYPLIDVNTWTLKITGLVDQEIEIDFADLLAMDTVEKSVTLSCVSNEVGGNLVGNAIWRGVPLQDVLNLAGVKAEATQIVPRSVDGWDCGFPTEAAYDGRTALVAFAMNDEPLLVQHGFPVRLVVSGLYGYVSATKWLDEIELTTWEDFDGFWIPRGWAKDGPIKTQSKIEVPKTRSPIAAGLTPVAGVAWAPNKSITAVEVRIDGGDWMPSTLSEEVSGDSWRQWMVEWEATPGQHVIECRATDGTGYTQTPELADPRPDGASGWHTIGVTVTA